MRAGTELHTTAHTLRPRRKGGKYLAFGLGVEEPAVGVGAHGGQEVEMLHASILAQAAELDGVAMVDLAWACKERER